MKFRLLILSFLVFVSCTDENSNTLDKGTYRGIFTAKDNQKIPFIFKVKNDSLLHIINAEEVIEVTKVTYENDSVKIQAPAFEGFIIAKVNDKNSLKGYFKIPSFNRSMPFEAYMESNRFSSKEKPSVDISGKWETVFSSNSKKNRYLASSIFKQNGNKVNGTIITGTGDYRFLEGIVEADSLKLSVFDGAHVFLFKAKVTDSTLTGLFYSGNHWKEPFEAKLNNDYELPFKDDRTFIKKGYENFDFSFPDTRGRIVSLSDKQFRDKVVLVQIMGSWCPNSLDETKFLVNYLKENPNKDLEVISLDIEVAKQREVAFQNINRLKNDVGIDYNVLLAQFGENGSKKKALEKLPMINKLISYPTLLVLDKKRRLEKIYTSFNGPATGQKHENFKLDFDALVKTLLKEE